MNTSVDTLWQGLVTSDKRSLSRAITLVESTRAQDKLLAAQLLEKAVLEKNKSHRIAITGVPGVGKSTFIEALGTHYCDHGHRVAVLAVDPRSSRSGGSILGDKTRMEELSTREQAFIRPSASASSLGGVARKTRESILLCEAAGYDIILVETVGVGQSETQVCSMTDTFLLLMLAGAGDELQGIKRGIMEMADILLINKVEEANQSRARQALGDYRTALHLLAGSSASWTCRTGAISALEKRGIEEAAKFIQEHRDYLQGDGRLEAHRRNQDLDWFEFGLQETAYEYFLALEGMKTEIKEIRQAISEGKTHPMSAQKKLRESLNNRD